MNANLPAEEGLMDRKRLEEAKQVLAPWWPGRWLHRHLVMALIGPGVIPLLRPDKHIEFLLVAWLLLPLTSPRVRAIVAGWFGR